MEQINPYAVMRNTATNDAYRAYMRDAYKAGRPFFLLGVLPVLAMPVAAMLLHRSLTSWQGGLGWLSPSLSFLGLCIGIAFMRIAKYRRDHPIPDEWRQVPRGAPTPARKTAPR